MSEHGHDKSLVPRAWEGDFDELIGHEDELEYDPRLSDALFPSKHEAFIAGLFVARTQTGAAPAAPAPQTGGPNPAVGDAIEDEFDRLCDEHLQGIDREAKVFLRETLRERVEAQLALRA